MGFFNRLFFDFGTSIGVDLGTASILIYVKNKGIVLNEPSVVAMNQLTHEIIAIGAAAKKMLGRTPNGIVAVRPLREGVIADYEVTEQMLRYFLEQACGRNRILKPRVMVCIPSGVTDVEERAVKLAQYIIENGATVRAAAVKFGISKSTVHKDLSERLPNFNKPLYLQAKAVLEENKAQRHIRGGIATRKKYKGN